MAGNDSRHAGTKNSITYAYIKYVDPCTNTGDKHPTTEAVHVDRIVDFNPTKLANRAYRVLCGKKGDNYCRATVSVVGESWMDVVQKKEQKRAHFAAKKTIRNASDTSSASEVDKKKKKSQPSIVDERTRNIAQAKLKKFRVGMKDDAVQHQMENDRVDTKPDGTCSNDAEGNGDSGVASSSDDRERNDKKNASQSGVKSRKSSSKNSSLNDIKQNRSGTLKSASEGNVTNSKKRLTSNVQKKGGAVAAALVRDDDHSPEHSDSDRELTDKPQKTSANNSSLNDMKQNGSSTVKSASTPGNVTNSKKLYTPNMQKKGGTEATEPVSDDYSPQHSNSKRKQTDKPQKTSAKNYSLNEVKQNRSGAVKSTSKGNVTNSKKRDTSNVQKKGGAAAAALVSDNDHSPEHSDSESSDDNLQPFRLSDVDSDADTIILRDGTVLKNATDTARQESLDEKQLDADLNQVVSILHRADLANASDGIDGQGDHAGELDESSIAAKLVRLSLENRVLRALNLKLQRKLIINCEQVEATITKVDLSARHSVKERICTGEDLDVGFENRISGMMHAGHGFWIKSKDYHNLRLRPAINPSKFIANIARFIFTDDVLKRSSVTGKVSNAHRMKDGRRVAAKPPLDPTGLDAVSAITRHWMASTGADEEDIFAELTKLPVVISKKISDMNRRSPCNRTKGKVMTRIGDVNESGDDESDETASEELEETNHNSEKVIESVPEDHSVPETELIKQKHTIQIINKAQLEQIREDQTENTEPKRYREVDHSSGVDDSSGDDEDPERSSRGLKKRKVEENDEALAFDNRE